MSTKYRFFLRVSVVIKINHFNIQLVMMENPHTDVYSVKFVKSLFSKYFSCEKTTKNIDLKLNFEAVL